MGKPAYAITRLVIRYLIKICLLTKVWLVAKHNSYYFYCYFSVISQLLCGYSTLPLYAIISQVCWLNSFRCLNEFTLFAIYLVFLCFYFSELATFGQHLLLLNIKKLTWLLSDVISPVYALVLHAYLTTGAILDSCINVILLTLPSIKWFSVFYW
jgi:hypothetical protein